MQKESTPGLGQRFVLIALLTLQSSCSSEVEFTGSQGANKQAPVKSDPDPASEDALPGPETVAAPEDDQIPEDDIPDQMEDDSPELSLQQFNRVIWDFPCSNDGDSRSEKAGDVVKIRGHGNYKFDKFELEGAGLILSGEVCPPEKIKRDIVFIIDVSGSMGSNDPVVGGSCGRMKAVQEVINRSPADGTAGFGVVTFDGIVRKKSAAFSDNQNDLFAGISGNPADAVKDLCMISGGTNYRDALNAATELLAKGRSDATKEIYFISDGAPNTGLEGLSEAGKLKNDGLVFGYGKIKATIVTIMLKGTDTVLESSIASKDPDGKALHTQVDKSDVLAKTLADLFTNKIVQAQVRYRPKGSTDWIKEDLLASLSKNRFELAPIEINGTEFAEGLEVEFSYRDHLNQTYLNEAGISWHKK